MTNFFYCLEHKKIITTRGGMHWQKTHTKQISEIKIHLGEAKLLYFGKRDYLSIYKIRQKLKEILGRELTKEEIKEIDSK